MKIRRNVTEVLNQVCCISITTDLIVRDLVFIRLRVGSCLIERGSGCRFVCGGIANLLAVEIDIPHRFTRHTVAVQVNAMQQFDACIFCNHGEGASLDE